MTALDRYLSRVGRHLMGLSSTRRQDVLMELRSNVMAEAEAEGISVEAVVESMASPRETARQYLDLYGYGLGVRAIVTLLAAGVAFLTVPFAPVGSAFLGTSVLANASLVLLVLLLVIIGNRMGKETALPAGIGAAGARFGALGLGLAYGTPELATEPVALAVFVVTTLVLVFAGYLAAPRT